PVDQHAHTPTIRVSGFDGMMMPSTLAVSVPAGCVVAGPRESAVEDEVRAAHSPPPAALRDMHLGRYPGLQVDACWTRRHPSPSHRRACSGGVMAERPAYRCGGSTGFVTRSSR